jgi:hypothetical protein
MRHILSYYAAGIIKNSDSVEDVATKLLPYHAKSSKQKLVATSSTEAELIGIFDYSSSIICQREFLLSQGYLVGPATIHNDNISTLTMIDRGKHIGERTKHIHIVISLLRMA